MKYITKIFLALTMFGAIAALIVGEVHDVEFGTWGVVAIVALIALCLIFMALPWITKNFKIEYSKKDGLKITEEE